MSECVVRMEMPVDYCPIGFAIVAKGYCPVAEKHGCDFDVTKERPDWCPIICSLPEGHGRLIDADKMEENRWDVDTRCGYVQVVDVGEIDNAPTIVPAERSET